jgi:hypothetical protein
MARLQDMASQGAFQVWWPGPQSSSLPGLRNEGCRSQGVSPRTGADHGERSSPAGDFRSDVFLVKVPVGRYDAMRLNPVLC